MILVSANPTQFTGRKASTGRKAKKGATMAKRHRSAAQKAATRKMLAANRARKTHHNPTARKAVSRKRRSVRRNPVAYHRRRRVHRNPSLLSGGGILGELLSMKGVVMVGAAFAAPMAATYLQNLLMPTATGWTKVAVKAGIVLAGAYAIDKFVKQRNAALAFGITGIASVGSDVMNIVQGVVQGLSADQADMLANRPELIRSIAAGQLGTRYEPGMGGPYGVSMAGLGEDNLSYFNGDNMSSGFAPAFPNARG